MRDALGIIYNKSWQTFAKMRRFIKPVIKLYILILFPLDRQSMLWSSLIVKNLIKRCIFLIAVNVDWLTLALELRFRI